MGIEKKNAEIVGDSICFDCVKIENINGLDKTVSITDLLARAEAAEARCETLEKMVKEYQEVIIPGYGEQAEKAERERDAAVKVIERVRSCKDCGHYTGEWTPPCKECQDSEEHHPYFKWRGQKKD